MIHYNLNNQIQYYHLIKYSISLPIIHIINDIILLYMEYDLHYILYMNMLLFYCT